MTLEAWGDRLAPDIPETLRRFPLPLVFAAAATLCVLLLTNEVVAHGDETAMRAALGFATAAVFAVAGVFFAESRPRDRTVAAVLSYVVPVTVVVLFQVRDTTWFVPHALPVIGTLWLSTSAFTEAWRGPSRTDAQNRFWWLNHRAVASGAIAGLALGLITTGVVAIERTVATLFGLDVQAFYRTVLPLLGCFFAPLYWLSTLPRLRDFDPRVMEQPDFLARAVALLGKFVLIPLLLAYALILLAYVAQIVVTQSLPQGVLGWMVMGFVMAGASTWLVLYPPFVRGSAIVRFYNATWFWLTLLPLGLFTLALYVRVEAYGLTPERLLLFWGGAWAALLAVLFLARRGDIRLIPGLAALTLLVATFGPWNVDNLPRVQQGLALDALLSRPGPHGESVPPSTDWSADEKARVIGAITYLGSEPQGQVELARVLRGHGVEADPAGVDAGSAMRLLAIQPGGEIEVATAYSLGRDLKQPVDLSAVPWLIGRAYVSGSDSRIAAVDLTFRIEGRTLVVLRRGERVASADLGPLVDVSIGGFLPISKVAFEVGDRRFALVVDLATVHVRPNDSDSGVLVDYVDGVLFSSRPSD